MNALPLKELTAWMDSELRVREIADYAAAVNGLQLENRLGQVTRVAAAVDASLPVVRQAVAAGADLLLVHHGLFWTPMQPLTESRFEKIATAMEAGLAIYSAHLPLDAHPVLGNNAGIVQAMGLEPTGTFFDYKGTDIGLVVEAEMQRAEVLERFRQALDGGAVHFCPGGPEVTRRIGICSGGSGSEVAAAAAAGIDTFLTGEGPHWSYPLAEELGVNLLYGGHYATETFGVKALAQALETRFGLPWEFLDHPTGL
ncbi:MAG: Nif3-like dinuclear metal center hexameric protein [Verrucomicrobiales bacterium]|nr:Nif3-like dinuclear metal center hexameric protein [Verrucomicrobiales bacterium]